MSRTESTSIQVHPNDEQGQINLMQKFHWNLLNSQTVDTKNSSLERRGDEIYSTTSHTNYVKLQFSRSLDLPNLKEIKQLEQEFNSLHNVAIPPSAPGWLIGASVVLAIILWIVAHFVVGLIAGIGIIVAYTQLSSGPAIKKTNEVNSQISQRREEILKELERYD